MGGKTTRSDEPITIKKYANRRLYNTATSSYVTLDHLAEMVKSGQEFNVYDAKTNDDITRSVLTQIIFEEENKGQNLLPIQFLRQLIGFYGDQMGAAVPRYLEMSMETFARNQEVLRQRVTEAPGVQAYKVFEDMARQNMALFQESWMEVTRRMMGLSAPTVRDAGPGQTAPAEASGASGADHQGEPGNAMSASMADPVTGTERPAPVGSGLQGSAGQAEVDMQAEEIDRLRQQVDAMQRRLDGLGPTVSPGAATDSATRTPSHQDTGQGATVAHLEDHVQRDQGPERQGNTG